MQRNSAVRLQADAHRRRIGEGSVPASIPHSRDTRTSPERTSRIHVELRSFSTRLQPSRSQGLQTRPNADSLSEHLSSYRGSFAIQRVQASTFEPTHRTAIADLVVDLLLRDSRT